MFHKTTAFSIGEKKVPISKEQSDAYENKAREILAQRINIKKICTGDKICVNTQDFSYIINACEEHNDFFIYRSILCQLDVLIDINKLVQAYNYNNLYDGSKPESFDSLNENVSETGITIIPKVPSPPNTFFVEEGESISNKEYKDGNYWYDNINEHFNNIICIQNTSLNGYVIKNIVVDLFPNRDRKKFVIGVTPCCNDKPSDVMDVEKYCDKKNGKQYFKINGYKDSKALTEKFIKTMSKAKESNVDILIGPEMLGSLEMSETDLLGYNSIFRERVADMPPLLITPTVWIDGKNFLSVYLNTGELIGQQYKQHSFEYAKAGEHFEEDLKDTPREILLIHVPNLGRIVFPICVDFLVARYRDMLARDLKATLMLCPSYSSGVVQFGNASGSVKEFGTRLIWINSCSALREIKEEPDTIGLVSVPVTNPINIEQSVTPIKRKCNGTCLENCLFTITIQSISEKNKYCNEVEIKHVQLE